MMAAGTRLLALDLRSGEPAWNAAEPGVLPGLPVRCRYRQKATPTLHHGALQGR